MSYYLCPNIKLVSYSPNNSIKISNRPSDVGLLAKGPVIWIKPKQRQNVEIDTIAIMRNHPNRDGK